MWTSIVVDAIFEIWAAHLFHGHYFAADLKSLSVEWAALIFDWLTGRTSALLPGPKGSATLAAR